jgi:hypothetical protein
MYEVEFIDKAAKPVAVKQEESLKGTRHSPVKLNLEVSEKTSRGSISRWAAAVNPERIESTARKIF